MSKPGESELSVEEGGNSIIEQRTHSERRPTRKSYNHDHFLCSKCVCAVCIIILVLDFHILGMRKQC